MAEQKQKQKQEIPAMRGTFSIRGIVTSFDKVEGFESETSKKKIMRKITFDVTSSEGNVHRMQLQAFQTDKVYFSGRKKDEKGNDKTVVQEVNWNDRLKYKEDGMLPIDRVAFGLEKVKNEDTGKEENKRATMLTYDAIPEIFEKLKEGMSLYIRGNIQVEEYTTRSGEKRNTSRFFPTQIYLTQQPIDFKAEDFKEEAMFELQAIAEEIEFTGSEEAQVTGLVIGNQRIGRQTLLFKEDKNLPENFDLNVWFTPLRNFKNAKKYISATFVGNIVNTANSVDTTSEAQSKVDEWGIPVDYISPLRQRGNGFRREFICTGIVRESIDNETYNPENLDTFISQFINPKSEFGETSDADDFAF